MAATPPIFLSYSRSGLAAADELYRQLNMAGAGVFKDDRVIRSSDRWLDELQQAVAGGRAFIVLIARDGVQRWVGAEVGVALNRHLSSHGDAARLPIHPILLGDTPVAAPGLTPAFRGLSITPVQLIGRGLLLIAEVGQRLQSLSAPATEQLGVLAFEGAKTEEWAALETRA